MQPPLLRHEMNVVQLSVRTHRQKVYLCNSVYAVLEVCRCVDVILLVAAVAAAVAAMMLMLQNAAAAAVAVQFCCCVFHQFLHFVLFVVLRMQSTIDSQIVSHQYVSVWL